VAVDVIPFLPQAVSALTSPAKWLCEQSGKEEKI